MIFKKIRPYAVPAVLLILLFFSTILLADALFQRPSVQAYLIKSLSDISGFHIRTGKIELDLWGGVGISARGFEATSRDGTGRIFASRVKIILDAKKLLKRKIVPVRIYLSQPRIELELEDGQDPLKGGQVSFSKGIPPPFWIPGLRSVCVEGGQVVFKNRPYNLKDMSFDVMKKMPEPLTLFFHSRGMLGLKEAEIPFSLGGTVTRSAADGKSLHADLMLETGKVPLGLIPWPESMPVKRGNFKAALKIKGDTSRPISVGGRIVVDSLSLWLLEPGRDKEYSVPNVTIQFQSMIEGRKIKVPSLQLNTHDLFLSLNMLLDLEKKDDPFLEMDVKSRPMAFRTCREYFPFPLLPLWVEKDLFPLLRDGDVRLKSLALKGRISQFRNLNLRENNSALGVSMVCEGLRVMGKGIKHPFKDVAAEVAYKKGNLLVSGLSSNFKGSKIREGSLVVKNIQGGRPSYDVLVDGIFDLHALLQQKGMVFIPPDVIKKLDQMGSVSGEMECRARIRYEHGWEFPRTKKGRFIFRDCLIRRKDLLLPLLLKETEIHIDEDNNNRFRGKGSWGNTIFEAIGGFGYAEKVFPLQWANISAGVDMNEVFPMLYHGVKSPLTFSGPVISQLALKREKNHWACQGKIDLEGVILENEEVSLDPPGDQDHVIFDLDFTPAERIDLKKFQFEFRGASLGLSGFYDLRNKDIFSLEIMIPSLHLEDLGIQFKRNAVLASGLLKGHVKIMSSRQDPLSTMIFGRMDGKDISFYLKSFPSPVNDLQFKLNFSGKQAAIDSLGMRLGESPIRMSGNLTGWDGLKGSIAVNSSFLNLNDFFARKEASQAEKDREVTKGSFMDKMDIHVDLNARKGRWKNWDWGPSTASLDFKGGDIHIRNSTIRLEHGVVKMNGHVKRKGERDLLFSSHIRLKDQPVEEMLEGFGLKKEYMEGSLDMEALLLMKGKERKDLLSGMTGIAGLNIKKGTIKKSTVFIKILDFLSLQKIFIKRPPDISKEGLYFESIGGDVVIDKGVLFTKNFMMKSPVYNGVATGNVDMPKGEIDFVLGVQPLETIDLLVSKIPIIGYALTGKEKSFLTYYFTVKGPILKPDVVYVPFKDLGRSVAGVLKRLFLTPVRLFNDISKLSMEQEGVPSTDTDSHMEEGGS